MKKNLLQAYKQAPWRIQLQWIGLFLLGLVLVSAITGVYLSISAQAATSGRMIQSLESDMAEISNEIAELTAELAIAKSSEKMINRAEDMGFRLIDPRDAIYLVVPGYVPETNLVLAPPRANIISESPVIKNAYKSSLWTWFIDQIWPDSIAPESPDGSLAP